MHRFYIALAAVLVSCAPGQHPAGRSPPPQTGPEPAACTSIGCSSGLEIEFARNSWPAGDYRIVVDVDGGATACEGTLPLRACEAGAAFACSGAQKIVLGESGCALPAASHGLSGLSLETTTASQVTLTLEHAGALIGTTTFHPDYADVRPNGPDCPPLCRSAGRRLRLR